MFFLQSASDPGNSGRILNKDSQLHPPMKMKLPLIAAIYCSLSAVGSAFTLDFTAPSIVIGSGLPLTVDVPFYGSVTFTSVNGAPTIEVFEPNATKAISFKGDESIKFTFNGETPLNVTNQYIGAGAGEIFTFNSTTDPNEYILTLNPGGSTVNAGLQSVIFEQVPEPSSALLGVLGTALLAFRRRR